MTKNKPSFCPVINQLWCKKCGICVTVCPKKILDFDRDNTLYVKDPDSCIGCGMCENICPDFAIEIYESDKNDSQNESNNENTGKGKSK